MAHCNFNQNNQMKTIITIFCLLFFGYSGVAQSDITEKAKNLEERAKEAIAQDDFSSAINYLEESLELRKSKYPDQSYLDKADPLREVAGALDNLISAHAHQGNTQEMLDLSKVHVAWLDEGMILDEKDVNFKLDHIFSSLRIIESYENQGELNTALRLSNNLIESLENETNKGYQSALDEGRPLAYARRGNILKGRKDTLLSIKDHEKSLELWELRYEDVASDVYLKDIGRQAHILVQRYMPRKDTANGIKYAIKAADAYGLYIDNNPDDAEITKNYILSCNAVAGYLTETGDIKNGTDWYKESLIYNDKIYKETRSPEVGEQIAVINYIVYLNLKEQAYLRQAVKHLERRATILEEIEERNPEKDFSKTIIQSQYALAEAYQEIGDLKSALGWIDQSIVRGNRSINADPGNPGLRQFLYVREFKKYVILKEMGNYKESSFSLDNMKMILGELKGMQPEQDFTEDLKDIEIHKTELAYPQLIGLIGRIDNVESKTTKFKLQKQLLKLIKKNMKTDKNLIPSYVKHTNKKAWDGLFLQEFKKSEKDIKKAMKYDDRDPYLITNLAPSLLFQGKYEEAMEVYMKNYKKDFRPGEIILDGFIADMEEFVSENIIPAAHKSKAMEVQKKLEGLKN